ncbi:MAG: twin-arginine translocation signal domain-containing protein [Patescibacteria group bacterium]|nr:twin-arginine translocation signal domain-containing protein [Patescibacteria group bacterium]
MTELSEDESRPPSPPLITRRQFLIGAGAVGATVAVARICAATSPQSDQRQEGRRPTRPANRKKIEPTPTEVPKISQEINGVTVYFKNGKPVEYVIDDQVFPIDAEMLRKSEEKSRNSGQVEAVCLINKPIKDQVDPEKAKLLLKEPPPDTLSTEELTSRGIEIAYGQGLQTTFGIRKSAFAPGHVLENFKENSGLKLRIIFIAASGLHPASLAASGIPEMEALSAFYTKDIESIWNESPELKKEMLASVQTLIPEIESMTQDVASFRKNLIEENQKTLEWAYAKKAAGNTDPEIEKKILQYKARGLLFQETTNAQLASILSIFSPEDGVFVNPTACSKYFPGRSNESTILVWAGETFFFQGVCLAVDPQGKYTVNELAWGLSPNEEEKLQANQTHPKISEIETTYENSKGYLIRSDSPGITLRHELFELYLWLNRLASPVDSTLQNQVDSKVLQSFKESEANMANGDNSDYCFVFKVPEGYILTQNQNNGLITKPYFAVTESSPIKI